MAGASVAARNAATDAVTALGGFVSMHTADPGTTGASEVTGAPYARQLSTLPAASTGSSTGSQVSVPMPTGAGTTTITHWGLWTLVSGGAWITGGALPNAEVFSDGGGDYDFTPTVTVMG